MGRFMSFNTAIFGTLVQLLSTLVTTVTVTVVNQCSYDVSCALVDGVKLFPGQEAPAPAAPQCNAVTRSGTSFAATIDVGQTLMCGLSTGIPDVITQLEWMHNSTDNKLWFDASNIEGTPFENEGFEVRVTGVDFIQPPPASWPRCWDVYCPAGVYCPDNQVYNQPDSDRNPVDNPMRDCPTSAHLVWNICLTQIQAELAAVVEEERKAALDIVNE